VSPPVKPRPYRSPLRERRAAETRGAILDAAERLFSEHGYVRTRLSDVADAAGVSTATVKLVFGTKPDLLLSLWHRTLAGGVDDPPPAADRPEYRAIFETPDPAEKIRLDARLCTLGRTRMATLAQVIEAAAAVDDEITRLWSKMGGEFYENQRRIVEHLDAGGHLRAGLTVDDATDLLWTINSTNVYLMLVHRRGWSPDKYERWLADTLRRELLGEC
jgi:AcrR family transcriptional regulator